MEPAVMLMFLMASTAHVSAAPLVVGSTSTPATTTTAAPGVEYCSVSQPVRLAVGLAEASSLHLRLAMPSTPQLQPCRLRVVAPASYSLRVHVTPTVDVPHEDADDGAEDDDDVDGQRVRRLTEMLVGLYDPAETKHDAVVETEEAESCILSLYVEGQLEPWRSVDLCDAVAVRDADVIGDVPHNVSLEWSPPRNKRSLRAAAIDVSSVRREYPTANVCTVRTVRLASQGMESVVALELHDPRQPEDRDGPCLVNVQAPSRFRMTMVIVNKATDPFPTTSSSSSASLSEEADSSTDTDLADVAENDAAMEEPANAADAAPPGHPSCVLTVMHGCSSPLLSVDLCDPTSTPTLNFTESFPSNVTLMWTAPPASQRGHQLSSTVIFTAIGVGEICSGSQFVQCYSRPRSPPLCVPKEVACDGYYNCPMDANDEDSAYCRPKSSLIAEEQRNGAARITPDARESILEFLVNRYNRDQKRGSPETSIQSSPDTLSNYGPWGYLMLGMLVCGAFLMLCGLWECCCRQPKTTPTNPSHTPTTVLMPQVGATAGVLVLDSDLDDDPSRPPAYEELDQPPSYGILFPPGQPKDDAPDVPDVPDVPDALQVLVEERLAMDAVSSLASSVTVDAPFEDADDLPSLHSSSSTSSMTSSVTSASSLAPS